MSEGTSLSHTLYFFLSALRLLSGGWLHLHSCWGGYDYGCAFVFCRIHRNATKFLLYWILIDSLGFEFKFIYFHFCWSNLIPTTNTLPQFSQVSYCYWLLSLPHKEIYTYPLFLNYFTFIFSKHLTKYYYLLNSIITILDFMYIVSSFK